MSDNPLLKTQNYILIFVLGILLFLILLILQITVFPILFTNSPEFIVKATPYDLGELKTLESMLINATPLDQTQIPGVFALGMSIQIDKTGGDGLRIRKNPGTDSGILYLAAEGKIFSIIEGPKIKDSLIWWKIQSVEDPKMVGWSVQDYFSTIEN